VNLLNSTHRSIKAASISDNGASKSSYASGKNDESINKGGEKTWSTDSSMPGNVLCTVESVKPRPLSVWNPFESFDT